jgi:hypothetical protein
MEAGLWWKQLPTIFEFCFPIGLVGGLTNLHQKDILLPLIQLTLWCQGATAS